MQVGVLKTDGGPHPAEKWARMTAWMLSNHLIDVDENAASPRAVAIREARDELNQKLYKVLKEHHTNVQNSERKAVAQEGPERLAKPLDPAEHVDVDAVVDAVVAESKVHPELFAHFSKEETRLAVAQQLHRDFSSVMDVERGWHADGYTVSAEGAVKPNLDHDPRDPNVKAFKQARTA